MAAYECHTCIHFLQKAAGRQPTTTSASGHTMSGQCQMTHTTQSKPAGLSAAGIGSLPAFGHWVQRFVLSVVNPLSASLARSLRSSSWEFGTCQLFTPVRSLVNFSCQHSVWQMSGKCRNVSTDQHGSPFW